MHEQVNPLEKPKEGYHPVCEGLMWFIPFCETLMGKKPLIS